MTATALQSIFIVWERNRHVPDLQGPTWATVSVSFPNAAAAGEIGGRVARRDAAAEDRGRHPGARWGRQDGGGDGA